MKEENHSNQEDHLEVYGDTGIKSAHAPVPKWLILTYIILPIWGIVCWHLYWNGSQGFLDRGSWRELQEAANTTYPFKDYDETSLPSKSLNNP